VITYNKYNISPKKWGSCERKQLSRWSEKDMEKTKEGNRVAITERERLTGLKSVIQAKK
jgi:hypothetical protein